MSTRLSPEDETRLRAKFRIEYQFLVDLGVIPPDVPVTRGMVRDAILSLPYMDREALCAHRRRRLDRLETLMDGTPKSFEAPHITHEDLVDGVRLPDYHSRSLR